jgi:hypothetical protein
MSAAMRLTPDAGSGCTPMEGSGVVRLAQLPFGLPKIAFQFHMQRCGPAWSIMSHASANAVDIRLVGGVVKLTDLRLTLSEHRQAGTAWTLTAKLGQLSFSMKRKHSGHVDVALSYEGSIALDEVVRALVGTSAVSLSTNTHVDDSLATASSDVAAVTVTNPKVSFIVGASNEVSCAVNALAVVYGANVAVYAQISQVVGETAVSVVVGLNFALMNLPTVLAPLKSLDVDDLYVSLSTHAVDFVGVLPFRASVAALKLHEGLVFGGELST